MALLTEFGLTTLSQSPLDVHLIILSRFVRFFAFGGSTIVLALYLHALSIPDSRIGLFLSLALLGDLSSFILTLFADRLGRRLVLAFGAALMVGSGLVFAFVGNVWVLMGAAILGVVSPKYALFHCCTTAVLNTEF
jgi:MFS family permease